MIRPQTSKKSMSKKDIIRFVGENFCDYEIKILNYTKWSK